MRVTLYKATDGSLHESHKAYAEHESSLKVLTAVLDAPLDFAEQSESDYGSGYSMGQAEMAVFIAKNAVLLRLILNEASVVKRERKTVTK